jgi:hypothetical protein
MDHIVYLDAKSNELEKLLTGEKSMIIRGASGRKLPYDRVNRGDVLYFINNNAEGNVKLKSIVESVFNSDKLSVEESVALVKGNQNEFQLTEKQFQNWAGKRYVVLIGVSHIEEIKPFAIDKSSYGNMDDWLAVERIDCVQK